LIDNSLQVDAGKLAGKEIGLRVGKVINQYKMAKHFELAIGDTTLSGVCPGLPCRSMAEGTAKSDAAGRPTG
jgi:hypothetical protein